MQLLCILEQTGLLTEGILRVPASAARVKVTHTHTLLFVSIQNSCCHSTIVPHQQWSRRRSGNQKYCTIILLKTVVKAGEPAVVQRHNTPCNKNGEVRDLQKRSTLAHYTIHEARHALKVYLQKASVVGWRECQKHVVQPVCGLLSIIHLKSKVITHNKLKWNRVWKITTAASL